MNVAFNSRVFWLSYPGSIERIVSCFLMGIMALEDILILQQYNIAGDERFQGDERLPHLTLSRTTISGVAERVF